MTLRSARLLSVVWLLALAGCSTLGGPEEGIFASLSTALTPKPLKAGNDWERARQVRALASTIERDPVVARLTPLVKQNPEANLTKLVKALTAGRAEGFERVRAIHDWIAKNIAYDFAAFQGKTPTITDPYGVLRRGASVCQGYSELFSAMCSLAGIESQVVAGYGRGYGFDPFTEDSQPCATQHAWDAVLIDDGWYLVDVTWDAGAIDGETNAFKWDYSTGFLFTPPEVFLCSHFPEDPRWQLLDVPLALPQLRAQPVLWGDFGTLGFARQGDMTRVASVGEETEIVLRAPPRMRLGAFLSKSGTPITGDTSCQVVQKQDGDAVRLKIMFPTAGRYSLALNAFAEGDTTSPVYLGELYYVSTGGSPKRAASLLSGARAIGFSTDAQDGYVYTVGDTATFTFTCAADIMASLNGGSGKDLQNRVHVTRQGGHQAATVSFPAPGDYTVWLMAQGSDPNTWTGIASLTYVATKGSALEFPSVGARAVQMGISLGCEAGYDPRVGGETQFSVRSSEPLYVSMSDASYKDVPHHVFMVSEGDLRTVKVSFPQRGDYTVWISAAAAGKKDSWESVASVHFAASGAGRAFPTLYMDATQRGYQLIAPLDGQLKAGQDVAFDIKGPAADVVYVETGGKSVQLKGDAGHFRGTVRAVAGTIEVYGGSPGGSLVGLVEYTAN